MKSAPWVNNLNYLVSLCWKQGNKEPRKNFYFSSKKKLAKQLKIKQSTLDRWLKDETFPQEQNRKKINRLAKKIMEE